MIGLTGSPRFGDIVFSSQAEVECSAEPLPVIRDGGRDGREDVIGQLYRISARIRYAALTATEAADLQSRCEGAFDLETRSEAVGDPDWAEPITIRAEATSPPKLTESSRRTDGATGEVLYDVEIQVSGLAQLARSDFGLQVGAYVLIEETETSYEVGTEEGATITDRPDLDELITFTNGDTGTIEWAEFGDPRTVAARIDSVSDPYYHVIQARQPAV
ncbi:MAG: hypothetical protein AAGI52_06680 [Bacteroidota bacterium]